MKTVISNTSPVRYLTSIDEQKLLVQLFEKIFVPKAVFQELCNENTPKIVRNFMHGSPAWIAVCDVKDVTDHSLQHLDAGEREAILLAEQMGADLLLIDEKKGRLTAIERGLRVVGTLGILELADLQYKIDLPDIIEKLLQTNFNISPSLIDYILNRHARRI